MKTCIHCPHPEAAHGKAGKCRIGRCTCPGFDDGAAKPKVPGFRRVAIDVPDGYAVQVVLIPQDSTAPVPVPISEVPTDGSESHPG